jgi:hypothetical protein
MGHSRVQVRVVEKHVGSIVQDHVAEVQFLKGLPLQSTGDHHIRLRLLAHDALCRIQQRTHPHTTDRACDSMPTGTYCPVLDLFAAKVARLVALLLVAVPFYVLRVHTCAFDILDVIARFFLCQSLFRAQLSADLGLSTADVPSLRVLLASKM